MTTKIKTFLSLLLTACLISLNFATAAVYPSTVNETLAIGDSVVTNKTVDTPEIPPELDVCLLEDETGSFHDDIIHLQAAASAIHDNVVAVSPDAHFAVAGFRDYDDAWVYRLLSGMSSHKTDWMNGIGLLTASGGGDWPEAQYDAIVAATDVNEGCGWRDDSSVTRVLLVATDAAFHIPPSPYVNDHASTVSALTVSGKEIIVIGLEGPNHLGNDPGSELDDLALETGGSVQVISSDGANIAAAILAGLGNLPTTVTPVPVGCDPLIVTFAPTSQTATSGDPANFVETITVPNDSSLEGTIQSCTVEFRDENENILGEQKIRITISDTTPPKVACIETTNPHGKNVPPAGHTTLPGSKGGQNEDGFYQLLTKDVVDPNSGIYVKDTESGIIFGPFENGTKIKYTEANSLPKKKKIGSDKGEAGDVLWHITGNGDAAVYAVDFSGNESAHVPCLVPPLPK
ncbi:MAG: hypothetical protein KAS07_00865 [Candidatus Pacebacteria bacterium]|nr:hypothetical protein [Candidatus Paceibacterota bacterium]